MKNGLFLLLTHSCNNSCFVFGLNVIYYNFSLSPTVKRPNNVFKYPNMQTERIGLLTFFITIKYLIPIPDNSTIISIH